MRDVSHICAVTSSVVARPAAEQRMVNLMFLVHLVFLVNLFSDSLESSDSGEWGVSG